MLIGCLLLLRRSIVWLHAYAISRDREIDCLCHILSDDLTKQALD